MTTECLVSEAARRSPGEDHSFCRYAYMLQQFPHFCLVLGCRLRQYLNGQTILGRIDVYENSKLGHGLYEVSIPYRLVPLQKLCPCVLPLQCTDTPVPHQCLPAYHRQRQLLRLRWCGI